VFNTWRRWYYQSDVWPVSAWRVRRLDCQYRCEFTQETFPNEASRYSTSDRLDAKRWCCKASLEELVVLAEDHSCWLNRPLRLAWLVCVDGRRLTLFDLIRLEHGVCEVVYALSRSKKDPTAAGDAFRWRLLYQFGRNKAETVASLAYSLSSNSWYYSFCPPLVWRNSVTKLGAYPSLPS